MATKLSCFEETGAPGEPGTEQGYLTENAFSDDPSNTFEAGNSFAGQGSTIQDTILEAATTPAEERDPYNSSAVSDKSKELAEAEKQNFQDYTDYSMRVKAARAAHDAKYRQKYANQSYDDGNFLQQQQDQLFYYNVEDAPDWLVGRGLTIPEGSSFSFNIPAGAKTTTQDPFLQWNEFLQKYREEPLYDRYSGEYHRDVYPKEWIQMAKYLLYKEKNPG